MLKYIKHREVIRDRQHGFIKGKSCLTNLVAFYIGLTAPVDNRRAADIYLDCCKAFDKVPYNILTSKLEIYGFNEWPISSTKNQPASLAASKGLQSMALCPNGDQ